MEHEPNEFSNRCKDINHYIKGQRGFYERFEQKSVLLLFHEQGLQFSIMNAVFEIDSIVSYCKLVVRVKSKQG